MVDRSRGKPKADSMRDGQQETIHYPRNQNGMDHRTTPIIVTIKPKMYSTSEQRHRENARKEIDEQTINIQESHHDPSTRTSYSPLRCVQYKPPKNPSSIAVDIIVIGFHFTFRGYSNAAAAVTNLILETVGAGTGGFDSPELNKENYHLWRERHREESFWALQRDKGKCIDDVYNPTGWWNWELLMDCERKLELLRYRIQLIKEDPGGWKRGSVSRSKLGFDEYEGY